MRHNEALSYPTRHQSRTNNLTCEPAYSRSVKTRVSAAAKRILALKLTEIGKPGKGRIVRGFVMMFRDEIMRQPFFQEMVRKQKLASKKKRKKKRLS